MKKLLFKLLLIIIVLLLTATALLAGKVNYEDKYKCVAENNSLQYFILDGYTMTMGLV